MKYCKMKELTSRSRVVGVPPGPGIFSKLLNFFIERKKTILLLHIAAVTSFIIM